MEIKLKQRKGRLYQLLLNIAIWSTVIFIPAIIVYNHNNGVIPVHMPIHFFFLIIIFYFNSAYLIPRFLSKQKVALYITFSIVTIIILLIVHFLLDSLFEQYHNEIQYSIKRKLFGQGMSAVFVIMLSTTIKVIQNWYKNENQKKVIENEKLHSELSFLKSQINPHFLFNTLNNIYSLSVLKSDKAPEAILKLSEMMRYMIYDTEVEKVDLEKEINYLKNYIELQKIRLANQVEISFIIEGIIEDKKIEPMLLVSFIENSFKHGVSYIEKSKITINLKLNNGDLYLLVENPLRKKLVQEKDKTRGIGLINTKKRLNLLYPDSHKLRISTDKDIYSVELSLKLHKK